LSKRCIFISLLDKYIMKIILGRDEQLEIFEEAMQSKQSEFIAISGRRRIGKTYLVNQYFENEICFYLTGIQDQSTHIQLEAFTNELKKRSKKKVPVPKDWLHAFFSLQDYVASIKTKKKKVIFFDELPWMDTQRSGFIQKFAHFWNSWAAWEKNIILIIAGSSTSWMVKKVYGDRGGLHNRVTKRIWLEPFKLSETEAFFKHKRVNLSRYDMSLLYMAFGGIPYYLNEIKKGESASQCIHRLCFTNGSILKTEFDNLYHSIFNKADAHIKIVKTLAKYNYGLSRNELLKKAKIANSGGSTKILEELTAVGYVQYMIPFGNRSNNGKYILADFYSRFYLNFVENKKIKNWITASNSHQYKVWCGFAFEWLCHYHKDEITHALGIGGVYTNTSYLNIKGENNKINAQIDLLIERADDALNLCEIKFPNKEYKLSYTEAEKIRRKMFHLQTQIKKRQSVFPTMITTFGCTKNQHYLGVINNQVVLDDLFEPIKVIKY
jgi:uncharacterized protein